MFGTVIIPTHTFDLGHGRILATHVPAGKWDLRVTVVTREPDALVVVWAEPAGDNRDGTAFSIAATHGRTEAMRLANAWRDSATATVASGRIGEPTVTG